MPLLAGDVGATNARLALYDDAGPPRKPLAAARWASREFAGLEDAVRRFLGARPPPVAAAVFGVPGPVRGGRVDTTNLPWRVDPEALSRALGGVPVRLLNDLEAAAHGIDLLGPDDLGVLQPGAPEPAGNRALISAGTGLGEAVLVAVDGVRRPFATEAGHADFAARTDLEVELLRWLRRRHGRVGVERVVSGPGLEAIHRFLLETGRGEEAPEVAERLARGDAPAAIAAAGEAGASPTCALALDVFVSAYGAEAGNLALRTLATGGVFVGGGIAHAIEATMRSGRFLEAFRDKGRFRRFLETVPLALVRDPDLGLRGAALVASRLAGRRGS
jgi:glucokinase